MATTFTEFFSQSSKLKLRRFFTTCVVASIATAKLTAQSDFTFDQTIILPNIAPSADHAVVATNNQGDIFVAWNCGALANGIATKGIQGIFIPRLSWDSWQHPYRADILILGNPRLGELGGTDMCNKPDVISVGKNFVVSWPRLDVTTHQAQLECAQIIVNPDQTVTINSQAPGLGWVADPNVTGGSAGLMPDLVRIRGGVGLSDFAAVFYAHETFSKARKREYELRACTLDFRSPTPSIGATIILESDIYVDNRDDLVAGGRVLVDVVEDDFDNLVVAWEDFRIAGHGVSVDTGKIHLNRYRYKNGGLHVLEEMTFEGTSSNQVVRRPNLATSHYDQVNSVSLAFAELYDFPTSDAAVFYKHIKFLSADQPGSVVISDGGFPDPTGWSSTRPVPVHGDDLLLCVAGHFPDGTEEQMITWGVNPPNQMQTVVTMGNNPRRPAVDLFESTAVGTGKRVLAMVYETEKNTEPVQRRICLQLTEE